MAIRLADTYEYRIPLEKIQRKANLRADSFRAYLRTLAKAIRSCLIREA